MPGFTTSILLIHGSAGLPASLAVPLMRRRVGPDALHGFQVRRTRENPRVWCDAKAFAGTGRLTVPMVRVPGGVLHDGHELE